MLTVKHIRVSGDESLDLVNRVTFTPADPSLPRAVNSIVSDHFGGTIGLIMPNSDIFELTGGTIFVMNETGKTVARYDLGASLVPNYTISQTDQIANSLVHRSRQERPMTV